MDNAGVCVYRDEKPAIFAPEGYAGGRIVYPAFFSSREVKEMCIRDSHCPAWRKRRQDHGG